MLKAKAALDAKVAVRYRVVARRGDLDDCVVLHVQGERTSDPAILANRIRLSLFGLVPCAVLTHVVFTCKHQRTCWTNLNAVATVNTSRIS